jgi:hypothetical protein
MNRNKKLTYLIDDSSVVGIGRKGSREKQSWEGKMGGPSHFLLKNLQVKTYVRPICIAGSIISKVVCMGGIIPFHCSFVCFRFCCPIRSRRKFYQQYRCSTDANLEACPTL